MKLCAVLRCPHGKARQWYVVEALPDETLPAIEYCPVCDAGTRSLAIQEVE